MYFVLLGFKTRFASFAQHWSLSTLRCTEVMQDVSTPGSDDWYCLWLYHQHKLMASTIKFPLQVSNIFFDCPWRLGRHVVAKNNSEKVFWECDSIIMQNLSYIFLLFWYHGRLITWVQSKNIIYIIKFSTSDNAFRVLWLVHSISVISSYTLVWPYMVNDCAKHC